MNNKKSFNIRIGFLGHLQSKNGGFTLKTHQMFSVQITPERFKNATIPCHFGFCVSVKLWQGKITIINSDSFRNESFFSDQFSVPTKAERRRFQIPSVWRAFRKAPRIRDGYVQTKGLSGWSNSFLKLLRCRVDGTLFPNFVTQMSARIIEIAWRH